MSDWKLATAIFLKAIKLNDFTEIENLPKKMSHSSEIVLHNSKLLRRKYVTLKTLEERKYPERTLIYAKGTGILMVSSLVTKKDKKRPLQISRTSEGTKRAESFAFLIDKSDEESYDPLFLDDPELTSGKHKIIITLPSFMSSVVQYTRLSDLKKEINDQFSQVGYDIDPDITLTQIRKVKQLLLDVSQTKNIEITTLAKSFVYFEKLVLRKIVKKSNRKLFGAICLYLSCKANDIKDLDYFSVLEVIQSHMGISKSDILASEFIVFASLNFKLHIDTKEFFPHFERIFSTLEYSNIQEYLGERMYQLWVSDGQFE